MVSFNSLVSLTKDAREFVLSAHTPRKGRVRRIQGEGSHTRQESPHQKLSMLAS